jgi:hypothetical protein
VSFTVGRPVRRQIAGEGVARAETKENNGDWIHDIAQRHPDRDQGCALRALGAVGAVSARRVGRRRGSRCRCQPGLDPPTGPVRDLSCSGAGGSAAAVTSALKGWNHLRFEITEEPTSGSEGVRFSYTPELGVFHAVTGLHGDIMIPEDRLKAAVVKSALGETTIMLEIDKLLGKPWDDELETFRHAGEGAPVRWLHQVV